MDFKHKSRFPWLSQLLYSIKHRGFANTCSMGMKEWKKERELGIKTFGTYEPSDFSIEPHALHAGHLYQPSSSVIFERVMKALNINFKDLVFLDIGSGKGRAMILAAEHGFKKVIGVEYASELNEIAKSNIELIKDRFPKTEFLLQE
ncbi:hypothetical protein ACFLR1_05220, partial [Bacteroidota bacterium]